MMSFSPDRYNEWTLCRFTYDGDHKIYEVLFEGTEEKCRQYAYSKYTNKEQTNMCLIDYKEREWDL